MLDISYNLYYVKYKIREFIFQELMYPLYIDFYKIIGRKKIAEFYSNAAI